MDRKNGGLSSKCAGLIAVSRSSDVFEKVLAPLQKAFLYEESKEAFKYTSAFLFNNSILQEKYDAFRANRREAGFSQEELKEGYGFLLFDDISKAIEVGETGVLTGNSACKTLGDPSKGVYVSKYSDCLAPDHWYCGKAGFIVIIRLTKGRINKVEENYTQNFIAPSVGFDCHESKELPMVSGNTSSFLAYERTQYYLYELLPGECSKTTLSPSHVCPFAIVPFSYDDANTKATTSSCQELSEMDGNVLNGMMWSGQLHISSQIYNVRLKSRLGALIPVKLPPVVKVDQAVSMVTLRQFAPKAVFETHFAGEVSLDGICCSVYEFVPIEAEDPSLSLLIRELKDKDLGLTVLLDGSGFLILLPSSNFAACTGNESSVTEALQAMFLFPGSRAKQKDTKEELEESQITPDILPILPALDYAEIEVQKSAIGPSEDMRGQFVQQIKNYAALINSGLAATPSKDVNPLSQDYDDKSLTSLCYSPKWTNQVWQWMRSYLSYPVSFQLPVYSVTELLAGNKRQKEVLDQDKDYVCPSPLEQAPGTVCSIGPEELLSESTASDVSSSLQNDGANKDSETNSILNCPLSRNPTDELVVSISSEEGTTTVMDICLSGSNAVVATKHYEQQLSNTQLVATNTVMKPSENPTARKTLPRGRPKGKRKGFKRSHPPADEPLTTTSEKQDEGRPPSQCTSINDPPKTEWAMSECEGGKLTYKYKKVTRSRLQENAIKKNKPRRMENVTSTCFLTRKTDRCDLKPIITGCGRTLVPHGSLNVLQKIDYEQRIKTIIETSEEACQLEKTDQDPAAGRLAVNTTNNVNAGDKCHITEVVGSTHSETASSPQRTRTQEFGDHCMVNIAEDTSDRLPSSTSDISSHLNDGKRLLCKLKTLFSKRKRKNTQDEDSVLPVDSQSTEPSLKKCNSDMDREMLKTELNCQDSRERNKDVLRTFAQALGLMPKEVPDKIQETQNTGTLEKRLPISLEGQFIPPVVKSAQLRVPSPIQEKLQGKRRLQKRKTWGKSLRTPSSSTTKNPKNQVCAKSNSSEKNLKELFCSTGQSTNALNLLADLALGDGNNQLDPLPKDGAKLDNQSVLPSMLNQPADSRVLPSISPSPEGLVGGKDVIDLIAKEHTYSSSTTSQVPTTSSPEGMSQHDQNLFGPGLPALCNVPPEGTIELKASIEDMNKDAIPSRKFRRSRIFVEKEGSLKVTRKWKGNYDFELDSKFTNHPVEKTVCRGLHGSWNFAVKDNGEEARLIIHMWIGLFYSCPTPRFIHSIPLDLEDSLEMSDGMVLPSVRKTATVSIGDSEAQDLEPIQEDGIVLNQVSDVLDLSIKKQDVNDGSDISVSRHETKGKDASEAFIREAEIQDEGPAQYQAKDQALQVNRSQPSELDDDGGTDDNIVKSTSEKADASQQSATNLEHSAVNSRSEDKTCNSLCKVIANIIIQPQLVVETKASIDPEVSNIKTSEMGERNENLQNTEVAVEPPIEMDGTCEIRKGIDEDPNSPCTYTVGAEYDGDESKCKDYRNDADTCLPLIDNEDSTTEHKSPLPHVNVADNEMQSADVTPITFPHGSNENGNEDEDCQSASDQGHFTKEGDSYLKPTSVSDGHGTIKGDDPGVSCQSSPVGQPFEQGGKKDASTDEMLQMQCANSNASTVGGGDADDDTISEENSNIALDKLFPEEHDAVDEAKIEIFGAQEKSNDSTPLQDCVVGESQAEVLPDISVVSCGHQEQDEELIENKVATACILAQKAASHHQSQSPQDGVSRLLQDSSEMPVVGKDDSKPVEAGPQDLPLQDNPVEVVHGHKEVAMNIDRDPTSPENCKKVQIAESILPAFEDGDSKHKSTSEDSDVDDRCHTPTKEDGPVVYCQATLVGQPYEGDGKKDASSDEMLQMQYAKAKASMGGGSGDDTISEENLNIALDKTIPEEHDNNDSMDEANIMSEQNKSDNDSSPLQDGIVGVSQAEGPLDVSVVICDNQETAYILAPTAASHHQAHSPQDGVSKLLQDQSEISLVGKDDSKQEVEAGPQVLPLQDNPVVVVHEPKEVAMNIDVYRTLPENCEKIQMAENVLSVFEDSDSKHKLCSENSEMDQRCPTPTKGDGPVFDCQATLVGQPYEGDGKKDASSDEMLQTQHAKVNTSMGGGGGGDDDDDDDDDGDGDDDGDDTISKENLNIALDKTIPEEHDNNYSMDEANIEIVSEQNKSDNVSTSLQDGIVGESQAEVPPDVSVVSCDHQEQDEELIENEVETAYISAPTAACRQQAQSPQDGVSKLLQDQSEISLVGKDDSKQEVEAGPQVLPLQDSPVEVVLEPKDMAMNIDVCCTSPENCEKIQIVENVLSVFEDSDSKHKLCPEDSEMDQRCPTPTKEDGAVFYCQATLVGQPYEGNGKKDAYSDKMLQTQHAKANTSMGGGGDDDDGDNISKESLNIALDKTIPDEHDNNYSMNEANIEIVSEQNKSDNDSTLLQDGIVSESQAEVPPDVSVVGCDHQEQYDELIENEVETAYILAPKAASHHQAQSPQDGVSKLISDPSEKPLVGKDESKQEVEAGPQVLPFQENILEMANEPKEMAMNINVYNLSLENSEKVQVAENVLSVFEDSNYEHKLGSEAGELDERCPTPTVDENPYEYIPSLEQSISNEVGKSSPEKEHRTNSTLTHQWGTEVHAELELKTVGDQDPGRDLRQENQTPRSRLLETNDLPASLSQSPTLCRKTMDMDNYKTSHVNVGRSPAKQSPVKRKMFSEEGCSLPVPCPPKKMSNDQEICEAPLQSRLEDDSHPCSLCPVAVIKLSRIDSRADDIYKVQEIDNPAISNSSDDNQTKIPVIPTTLTGTLLDNQTDVTNCTSKDNQHETVNFLKTDGVSGHGVGECVLNKPNSIDALYQLEERGKGKKPSSPVSSIVSMQSNEGENLSSSSFHDPIQPCPVEKKRGQSSSIHSDDHEGVTDEEILKMGPSTSSFKYTNYRFTKTVSKSLEQLTETCIDSDLTQFSMEQDFLIFSEEMKQLLNGSKRGPGKNPNHRSLHSYPSSDGPQSIIDLSINVDVPESDMEETTGEKISYHHEFSSRRNSAEANIALSDIEAECTRSYQTMMDNICAGKSHLTETDGGSRDHASTSRQMTSEMFGSLNHGLNLVVRQSSKTKFRFYILMTSDDAFFEETKALLKADGHTEVQPSHFFLNEQSSSSSSLLLIILRNEDIAEHIIKVPHLLDLKKSANVLFAGIDQPDDIGNLTHQDLFKKGGFIMLEGTALEALSFCKMKELLDFLQELSKNGKWKWILHYRDSRRLKENARFSAEDTEKKHLMKCCQETGIVEVLPYHECDHMSRDHPSYLNCLSQLQVHNVTARFPVFVTDKTDATADNTFGRHGILTMNINSLLTVIESEKCSLGAVI